MFFTPITLLLSASIADILTTLFGLGVGLNEINPIVTSYGWIAALLGKLFATLLVTLVIHLKRDRLGALAFTPGLVVTLVVFWNLLVIAAHLH